MPKKTKEEMTFTADISMLGKYYYLPFSVPDDVETLELDFSYSHNKKAHRNERNKLDVALVLPNGKQAGATSQSVRHIVVSERYSTQGYHPLTPAAGMWQLLIGVAGCEKSGLEARFTFTYTFKEARWLKGDTHIHTYHSDGKYSPETVVKKMKKKGFDYAIFTDHNVSMANQYYRFWDPKLLVISGYELTSFTGHVNFWGAKEPIDLAYGFNNLEEYKEREKVGRENGCTVSVNHPTCKNCGWRYWEDDSLAVEKRDFPEGVSFDCMEVWNGPMRIDNVTAVKLWHEQLLKGRRIPAVGGSDYHENYAFVNLLGNPTTYVYARSNTTEDVLEALRAGRSFITHSPTSTEMYLTVFGKMPGETVKKEEDSVATLRLVKPKRGHHLKIYNNDTVILDVLLKGDKEETYRVAVPEKGFVRAEILYNYNFFIKAIYKRVLPILMPKDVGLPIPEFYYALTNPIWLE